MFRKLRMESLEQRKVLSHIIPSLSPDAPTEIVGPLAVVSEVREAHLWPFASNSPWNTAIGSNANYDGIFGSYNHNGDGSVNMTEWSHPIYYASESDPLVAVYWDQHGFQGNFRVPANARPTPESDHHMHVISPDKQSALEIWNTRLSNGRIDGGAANVTDLTGQGFYDEYHGVRAGGMSALGGLIRTHELENARIPHALAIAVDTRHLNRNAPGGGNWVWPASWADGGRGQSYGTSSNIYMGSLVAIPSNVNVENLGLSPQGLAIARAMQDYGAYITETGDGNFVVYIEPDAASVADNAIFGDVDIISKYVQVVANNGPNNIGGGGIPRQEAAPDFGQPIPEPTPIPEPGPAPIEYAVVGTVTGDGTPLAGAKMHLALPDWSSFEVAFTDALGQYSFANVADGDYIMGVWTSDYEWQETPFTVLGSNATVNFSLGQAPQPDPEPDPMPEPDPIPDDLYATIKGIVVQEVRKRRHTSESPVSYALVELLDNHQEVVARTYTDHKGEYTFDDVAFGNYSIRTSGRRLETQSQEINVDEINENLDFTLEKTQRRRWWSW